ncbi:Follicle-stimulating hormone receptor, partial [Trichinella sp. T6]
MLFHGYIFLSFTFLFQSGISNQAAYQDCSCYKIENHSSHCHCQGDTVKRIPENFDANMKKLTLANVSIKSITVDDLHKYKLLQEFSLVGSNYLTHVDANAFSVSKFLRRLRINDCPNLRKIDSQIILCNISCILSINLKNNALEEVPKLTHGFAFSHWQSLPSIELSFNNIKIIDAERLSNLSLITLDLSYNKIDHVAGDAFKNSRVNILKLNNNPIIHFSAQTFALMKELKQLDLSNTMLKSLPSDGFETVQVINLERIPSLKQLPSIFSFPNLRIAKFTYAHHCCPFQKASISKRSKSITIYNSSWGSQSKFQETPNSTKGPKKTRKIIKWFKQPAYMNICIGEELLNTLEMIECSPNPDALNPCEDVAGTMLVRIFIWIVGLGTIFANFFVLLWFFTHRGGLYVGVTTFFMTNLAIADLCMGIYLVILAVQDAKTAGSYYNSAVDWQTGSGCKMAGFFTVFSSELSVVTMVLISLEIWYNTRSSFYGFKFQLKAAFGAELFAWCIAVIFATLPIFNVNTYAATSICLPVKSDTLPEKIYLIALLTFNAVAFFYITFNYIHTYLMVSGVGWPKLHTQDWKMARKLAILIATNFLCWAPVILFGLSAAFGCSLISISQMKYLLVLVYPINSMANPFLYAFSTGHGRRWSELRRTFHHRCVGKQKRRLGSRSSDSTTSTLSQAQVLKEFGKNPKHNKHSIHCFLAFFMADATSDKSQMDNVQTTMLGFSLPSSFEDGDFKRWLLHFEADAKFSARHLAKFIYSQTTQRNHACGVGNESENENSDHDDEACICAIPNSKRQSQHLDLPSCAETYQNIVSSFKNIFRTTPGLTGVIEHQIWTVGSPIKVPPRRVPEAFRADVEKQLQEMLKQCIIEPSNSPWMAPALCTPKKSGEVRICVDYRELNKKTRKDAYPLSLPDDIFDK